MITFGDPRLPERFWQKIRVAESGCWEWTAARSKSGYARYLSSDRKARHAHRVSFLTLVGDIPSGLQLDHLCRVKHCVNPRHLEPVTQQENIRRAVVLRTTCRQGHPLAGDNLLVSGGARICRICKRAQKNACMRRKREAMAA